MASNAITIDGKTYKVSILSIKRKSQVLDKYAERTEDGNLHREIIGTYYNYEMTFDNSKRAPDDYDALFEVLTAPEEFHTISVPYGESGTHTYKAYISNVSDEVLVVYNGIVRWGGLTANFIAKAPARI